MNTGKRRPDEDKRRSEEPALQEKLDALPQKPGVYIFKDARGRIIYIGKAKSLRNRVRSYFTGGDDGRYQYPRLVKAIRDVEVLLTRDEIEALKTEATLINKHKPRYNVDLKDDKSFPYLKISHEPFPRVFLTRQPRTSDGDYYGPYTDLKPTKYLLRALRGKLQIRECSLPLTTESIAKGKYKICLDYHIGRCAGPCEGKVSLKEYRKGLDRFVKFIQGKHDEIIENLEVEMHELAAKLRFEEAASVRDLLIWARDFSDRQKRVGPPDADQDAIGVTREDNFAAFTVIKIRCGRIVGKSPFYMERALGVPMDELIEQFIVRHYTLVEQMPKEIFLPSLPSNQNNLETFLYELASRKVLLSVPQRGEKKSLVDLAKANADHLLLEHRVMAEKRDFVPRSLKALADHLHLESPPEWIEGFDISNLQGIDSVASMVVFKDGKPYKSAYRVFKIKTVEGIDDFASIGEAVERRYTRVLDEIKAQNDESDSDEKDEKAKKPRLPSLILIDGGKGQLGKAKESLDKLGLSQQPVIGLAKKLEEIFLPGKSDPIVLPKSSSALKLLQQVRDEAHRFAISQHRLLRGKRQIKSKLDDIPGIGPARRSALLKEFGSLKRIAAADVDKIAAVDGMSRAVAELVKNELTK